jgi:hypothetical protein
MGRASKFCSVGITLSWWGCQIMGRGYIHMCKSVIGLQLEMLHTTAFDQEIIEGRRIAANAILHRHNPRIRRLSTRNNIREVPLY